MSVEQQFAVNRRQMASAPAAPAAPRRRAAAARGRRRCWRVAFGIAQACAVFRGGAAAGAPIAVRSASSRQAAARDLGYEATDPARFDPALRAEAAFDGMRSLRDCWCAQSRHAGVFMNFYDGLYQGLAADPSFSGDWVHKLCGVAYPVIFRVISVDPNDDSFSISTDCHAGVLSMVSVCAQSAALQRVAVVESAAGDEQPVGEQPPQGAARRWRHTPRVVLEEGANVGDLFGQLPAEACREACEGHPSCRSFAHGPNGCHLKDRCAGPDDEMVPQGVQGDDYQTHYYEPCGDAGAPLSAEAAAAARKGKVEEMQSMMSFALRVLEFCFHCLDASPWPFLLHEVLENYALAVEAPEDFTWRRAAGRPVGPSTHPGPVAVAAPADGSVRGDGGVAGGSALPAMDPPDDTADALGLLPHSRLTLLRLQVRWTRGLEMEAEFWRQKLSPDPEVNDRLERLETWLRSGAVTWYLDGDDPCAFVASARERGLREPRAARGHGVPPPRLLNVGSGPLAPGPLSCAGAAEEAVPVIAADGLARYYLRIVDEHGLRPLFSPVQCPVEELHACFPPNHFDVVHMRNALDHVFDPVLGIQRMLQVARPGGWVLLRHARNEGVPGQFRNGLHQWAFDVVQCPDSDASDGGGGCAPSFLIWNPELRVDVTAYLLGRGLAAEVRTELRDHPSADAPPDERYVWVDIRKPTAAEAARRLGS